MPDLASVRVLVHGRVQGVYFRAFAVRYATELDLKGFTQNMPDWETVEVVAEGERDKLEKLIEHLRIGPPGARVDRVEISWADYIGSYSGFTIKR